MISHLFSTLLHASAQEDGALPGPGLTAFQTLLYFFITPVALFAGISVIVLIASADRSKNGKSDLSRID